QAVAARLLHLLAQGRVVVADDHRPPGTDVVDVTVAIDVVKAGAVGALHEERLATDRLERAHRRIDPAGQQLPCAGEQGMGAVVVHGVVPVRKAAIVGGPLAPGHPRRALQEPALPATAQAHRSRTPGFTPAFPPWRSPARPAPTGGSSAGTHARRLPDRAHRTRRRSPPAGRRRPPPAAPRWPG